MRLNFSDILVSNWRLGVEHFLRHWIHHWRSHTWTTHQSFCLNYKMGNYEQKQGNFKREKAKSKVLKQGQWEKSLIEGNAFLDVEIFFLRPTFPSVIPWKYLGNTIIPWSKVMKLKGWTSPRAKNANINVPSTYMPVGLWIIVTITVGKFAVKSFAK